MKKVQIDQVAEGEVVAMDICDPGVEGRCFPLIAKGVSLTREIIAALEARAITEILVQIPPGYLGKKGEILALQTVSDDIFFHGAVELECDLPPGIKVEAEEEIQINGTVGEGCVISSSGGAVIIDGSLKGSQEKPIKIQAAHKVLVNADGNSPLEFVEIKSEGAVRIDTDLTDCSISSHGKLVIKGGVLRSRLYTTTRMLLDRCGEPRSDGPCQLVVKPHEFRSLSQEILKIDKTLRGLNKELASLKNVIDLIKKLGDGVDKLSQEKKNELAVQVRRYQEIQGEMREFQVKKTDVVNTVKKLLIAKRITITGKIYPDVKIAIANYSLVQQKISQAVAFCIEDFKVAEVPI